MKIKITLLVAGAIFFLLGGLNHRASANHIQGAELSYACVAPGVYNVVLKLSRECYGAGISTATLNLRSVGCNAGRSIPLTKVGATYLGNPYCSSVPNTCNANFNYEVVQFTTTFIFSGAEQTCPNWVLSWSECCRPNAANLAAGNVANAYAEAFLNLGTTGGINNNSAVFEGPVVAYANHNQPMQISNYVSEIDGDSLVYRLEAVLSDNNQPVPFRTLGPDTVYNSAGTKFAVLPTGSYSSSFPLPSYAINWNQAMPITPVPNFSFNPKNGSIAFVPVKYQANAPVNSGDNKYVFSVKVEEYRRINGVTVNVGSVRRDLFLNVVDNGLNQNPEISSFVVNGQPITTNTIITVRPGAPVFMQFTASDGNPADILTLESNANTALFGASFNATTGNQPTGTITWTPDPNYVSSRIDYFYLKVTDNACPIKGVNVYTIRVKVSATGVVTAIPEATVSENNFLAFPNPFTQELTFNLNLKSKAGSIIIYNLLGQPVDEIPLKTVGLGAQKVQWKNSGKNAAGTYVARLVSEDKTVQTIKLTKLQ